MNILFALLPISLLLLGVAIYAFAWAVRDGQFEDLDGPALDILVEYAPIQEPPAGRSWICKSRDVCLSPAPARESNDLTTWKTAASLNSHCTMSDPEHRGGRGATTGSLQTSTAHAMCGSIPASASAGAAEVRDAA